MVMVATSLTCVVWLSQSLRFVDMIVNRGLTAGMFVYLTCLMIPNFLTIILPVSLFATTTFIYHRMIMDRELVVMSAAGVSLTKFIKPAAMMAILTVFMGYVLSIYLVPMTYTQFRELQWDIRYNFSHVLLREGTFNDISNGVTVYVRERTDDGQLLGILAHDERDKNTSFTLMSERGALVAGDAGPRVVMFNGSRQDFNKITKSLSILYFDRYVFELEKPKASKQNRHQEAREYTFTELINLDPNSLSQSILGKYHVEIHRRLALPWAALGFVMISLCVLMTGSFSRRGEGRRVFIGIILAAGYQASLLSILNAAARDESLIPAIYGLSALPIIIGGAVLLLAGRQRSTPAHISTRPPLQ